MNYLYAIYIPLIPLFFFLLLGIFYKKIKPPVSGWLGTLGLLTVFLISVFLAYNYFFVEGKIGDVYQTYVYKSDWMRFTDTLKIEMGVLIDPISVMMLIVVSTVSLLVHIYSTG
jgi:NADH-quinone oxidoreductase subunit L